MVINNFNGSQDHDPSVESNIDRVTSFPNLYKKKDGEIVSQWTDTETKSSFFVKVNVAKKIFENPNKPITIQKPIGKNQYGDGVSQQMMAYFPNKEAVVVYIGKVGVQIKNLKHDIATNGEIEMKIDIDHVKALLEGLFAHEMAIEIAKEREEARIDYLDEELVLPEGKWFSEKE
jgi:hypothetical protein